MSDQKKHFYVVLKGRAPGIYSQWTGQGGAEEQVRGFPGAVFRGFVTREEAEHYFRSGGQVRPTGSSVSPAPRTLPVSRTQPGFLPDPEAGFSAPPVEAAPVKAALSGKKPAHAEDLEAGKTVIFTDGASTGNPGPGGYGVVILVGIQRKELSGGYQCTTNNRMELMGVITALQALQQRSEVVLYSDSRYVVNAIQLGWAKRWRARGWMRDATNRAENADLWSALLPLLDQHRVEFRWVKGHASNPENERCDRLAVQAAHQRNLPVDEGFKQRC
jgi:ribonuclease HI